MFALFYHSLMLFELKVLLSFIIHITLFIQGVDEGWYDGGSIFLAVFLVILVTGNGFGLQVNLFSVAMFYF